MQEALEPVAASGAAAEPNAPATQPKPAEPAAHNLDVGLQKTQQRQAALERNMASLTEAVQALVQRSAGPSPQEQKVAKLAQERDVLAKEIAETIDPTAQPVLNKLLARMDMVFEEAKLAANEAAQVRAQSQSQAAEEARANNYWAKFPQLYPGLTAKQGQELWGQAVEEMADLGLDKTAMDKAATKRFQQLVAAAKAEPKPVRRPNSTPGAEPNNSSRTTGQSIEQRRTNYANWQKRQLESLEAKYDKE